MTKGRIFRRGRFWWVAYYQGGKEIREVARDKKSTEKIEVAVDPEQKRAGKFLELRTEKVTAAKHGAPAFLGPRSEKVTVNEILDDLVEEYENNDDSGVKRTVGPEMRSHLKRVRQYFGHMRAMEVNRKHVNDFIAWMKSTENGWRRNGTINRELQLLHQAYNLAVRSDTPKLPRALNIKKLDESDGVRKGKFSKSEAEAVFASLPDYFVDVARFAYETGTRAGELLGLKWDYLDGDAIAVPGADTKNGEPRSIFITPAIEEILARRKVARAEKCNLIFHRNGRRIVHYRHCWQRACAINGLGRFYCRKCRDAEGNFISLLDGNDTCPRCLLHNHKPKYIGRILHDFRRSAAHELWKSGLSKEECMEVTGHKTTSMFDRYSKLFSEEEKRERQRKAQERRREYRETENSNVVPFRKAGVQ